MAPVPTRMWQNGPCRLFSTERFLGAVPYSSAGLKGYAGAYLCSRCRKQTHKVLGNFGDDSWICEACAQRNAKGTAIGAPSRSVTLQLEGDR
jgi:hypothetical protein